MAAGALFLRERENVYLTNEKAGVSAGGPPVRTAIYGVNLPDSLCSSLAAACCALCRSGGLGSPTAVSLGINTPLRCMGQVLFFLEPANSFLLLLPFINISREQEEPLHKQQFLWKSLGKLQDPLNKG